MAFNDGIAPRDALNFEGIAHTAYRAYTFDAARLPVFPTVATRMDGVSDARGALGIPAIPGRPMKATAGAVVAAAARLELDATGRVITRAAGVDIGRALEAAAAADDVIWIVAE